MVKYLIRSIKYLVFISVLFAIIVAVLFYTSAHEPGIQPWDLFKWKQIVVFFVAVAAIYPLFGYWKREVPVSEKFMGNPAVLRGIFDSLHFEVYQESKDRILLHHRNGFIRFMRLYEDTITIEISEGLLTIEGQRKDVVRFVHSIEWEQTRKREDSND